MCCFPADLVDLAAKNMSDPNVFNLLIEDRKHKVKVIFFFSRLKQMGTHSNQYLCNTFLKQQFTCLKMHHGF